MIMSGFKQLILVILTTGFKQLILVILAKATR